MPSHSPTSVFRVIHFLCCIPTHGMNGNVPWVTYCMHTDLRIQISGQLKYKKWLFKVGYTCMHSYITFIKYCYTDYSTIKYIVQIFQIAQIARHVRILSVFFYAVDLLLYRGLLHSSYIFFSQLPIQKNLALTISLLQGHECKILDGLHRWLKSYRSMYRALNYCHLQWAF